MKKNDLLNSRVNLFIPLDISIHIVKEADKRGITRTQFIREAINDKINKVDLPNLEQNLISVHEELKELKIINLKILDKLNNIK